MSTTSPAPSRRLQTANINLRSRSRSRSASPSAPAVHNPPLANGISNNHLQPGERRVRRSSDTSNAENIPTLENIPLIEAEKFNPPLANPETDESGDDREVVNAAYPGVDDGFFANRLNPEGPTTEDKPQDGDDPDGVKRMTPGGVPMSPTNRNKPLFPELELGTVDLDSIPDINVYQHKKTLAQGMMDLALFSANANQLRYVVENNTHPYYYSGVALISISLIFQVAIGVGLIWNSRYNVKDDKEICIANKINNFTIIGIFLVTVVNVFISAFGVASVQPVVIAATTP